MTDKPDKGRKEKSRRRKSLTEGNEDLLLPKDVKGENEGAGKERGVLRKEKDFGEWREGKRKGRE